MSKDDEVVALLNVSRIIDEALWCYQQRAQLPRARALNGWRGWCVRKWRGYRQLVAGCGLGVLIGWWIA